MFTTIILIIILIKFIGLKVFLGFLATYSFLYLYIKFLKEGKGKGSMVFQDHVADVTDATTAYSSSTLPTQKQQGQQQLRMKFHYHKHKGQAGKGEVAISIGKKGDGKGITEKSDLSSTHQQSQQQKHTSSGSHTEHFIKSTVTIRKIIERQTLSTTKNQLIVKKSRILKTKKIVTIKSTLL